MYKKCGVSLNIAGLEDAGNRNKMSKDVAKEFGESVTGALSIFQAIESSLKLYITHSFKLIKVKLGASVAFNFSGSDYENAPLETLVKTFSRVSNNTDLVMTLRELIKYKNYVAQLAYRQYLQTEGETFHGEPSEIIRNISVRAVKCLALMQADLATLDKKIAALQG